MNFYALTFSVVAMFSSASALISFLTPTAGSMWYANVPNYMQINADNSLETTATVRFSSCNQCFALDVFTNSSQPVVIPRRIREASMLNIYAVSNLLNTTTSFVYVANNLPCAPCVTPCARRSRCGRFYAEDGAEQVDAACFAELKFVDDNSEQAKQMSADQQQAALDLNEDLAAFNAQQQQQQQSASK